MPAWKTSRRLLSIERPLVMAILNLTPDSFSDGGNYSSTDNALRKAEKYVEQGADIIDIGGESTRPGASRVSEADELARVLSVLTSITSRFDIPISVDTTRSNVAHAALSSGAEILNDISGLRFDKRIAEVAAATGAGLVLMHSRGSFETLHSQPPVANIIAEVIRGLTLSVESAKSSGVAHEQIAVDVGLGFSKTLEQNLELLAKLDKIAGEFKKYPMLVGASRKSFIGKVVGDVPPDERLGGSLATAVIAVISGAKIIRVHDVRETVQAIRTVWQIISAGF